MEPSKEHDVNSSKEWTTIPMVSYSSNALDSINITPPSLSDIFKSLSQYVRHIIPLMHAKPIYAAAQENYNKAPYEGFIAVAKDLIKPNY